MTSTGFIPTWTRVFFVSDEPTKVIVTVNRSDHRQPRYSIAVGTQRGSSGATDKPSPFLQPQITITNAKAQLASSMAEVVGGLIATAERWIEEDAQKHQDEWLAFRQDREQRSLDRDKPVQKPGLKSLAKKDAAKRQGTAT